MHSTHVAAMKWNMNIMSEVICLCKLVAHQRQTIEAAFNSTVHHYKEL